MNNSALRVLAIAAALAAGLGAPAASRAADLLVEGARVNFKEDKELPANEAGVLLTLHVEEGDRVEKGQQIGLIDDREPKAQKEVYRYQLEAAKKRATDDVEVRYAHKQAGVAEKDYEILVETNRRVAGAVSDVEVRRAKLDWDRALLSIDKATHDQQLAKLEAYSKLAELKAADLAILRRTVIAPFDGEVVEIHRKQDEWVNPGDPILRLVRRDVMHVEGAVDQNLYDPDELQDRDVTVTVPLARGQTGSAHGRIVYVSPYLRGDGRYVVRAEVANAQNESGNWILMDGQTARMAIHVDAPSPAAEVTRRP